MATTKKKSTKKKAPKKIAEDVTFMGLLKKGWECDKKILKSWKDFHSVKDVFTLTLILMEIGLVWAIVASILS